MKLLRQLHVRVAALVVAVLASAGVGAAYAATHAVTATPIGTGVVVIDTNLGYQSASAAGTGMVLTSSGEVLTNNHVIAGATKIKVVLPGTGRSYTARVVGYDVKRDVAVLQLQDASNLKTVAIRTAALTVGTKVTALGNAGGTGRFTSSTGAVTGLGRSISVQDDSGGSEQLSGMIETNATLQPGDSGGPLLDSAGRVVGMDTAGSTGNYSRFAASAESDGFAIPIATALSIAKQIEAGTASAAVHIGATGFLGVGVSAAQANPFGFADVSGLTVANVVSGGAADAAGLTEGDVISSVGGTAVNTQSELQAVILAHKPGDKLTVDFTDQYGQSGAATVTLASGPPQ